MSGISALHLFASPIYEWIRENKFSLVGGYSGGGVVLNELNKHKEDTLESFKKIYPENPIIMLNAVASLFPVFSNSVLYPTDTTSNRELNQAMRIAAKDRYDLYFTFSLDNITISRRDLNNSILNMEEQELRAYINFLNESKLFNIYLEEIKNNLSRIPEDRIELFLSVLVFQSGRVSEEQTHLIGANINDFSIYTISDLLFRIVDENKRHDIIIKMFSNTDFLSFQFLLHLLHIIELTYGRVAETKYMREEKLITLEHLYMLEEVFLERTKSFITEIDLLDWQEARRASFLWEFIDKESYNAYMKETLSNELSVPKYISIKASEWSESNGTCGYIIKDQSNTDFIDDTTIIDTINKVRFSASFWALDKRVIDTSAAFVLKSKDSTNNHEDNMPLINALIDEWKKEFTEQAAL